MKTEAEWIARIEQLKSNPLPPTLLPLESADGINTSATAPSLGKLLLQPTFYKPPIAGVVYRCEPEWVEDRLVLHTKWGVEDVRVGDELFTAWSDEGNTPIKYTAHSEGDKLTEVTAEILDARVGCLQCAADIAKEHRVWLWPGYLGRNKVAHFGGASSEGKSPVTIDIAARVSAGLPWPDGKPNESRPMNVVLLTSEDDWSDTIRPRLELAGADLNNIHRFYVQQKTAEITPRLDCDCKLLEQEVNNLGDVALVVIDPITNYLGNKKMNAEEEIRGGILMPLADVARNCGCTIITVGHFNKRGTDATVLQRLMGCAAFTGVARDVFIFGPDPDEEDRYTHVMSEIRNKSAPQLRYRTEAKSVAWDGQTSEVIKVNWLGVSHVDVDEVVNPSKQQEKSVTNKALNIMRGMLRTGAKRKSEIDQALKDNGIDPESMNFTRLKKRLGAETKPLKGQSAGWEWFLPTQQEQMFDEGK